MDKIVRMGALVLGVAIGAGIFSFVVLNKTRELQNKNEIRVNNQIIIADVAKTQGERERGLSGRNSLGVNEGMIFIFNEPQEAVFWMKDMKFPIDIVWVRDGKVLGFAEKVDPQIGVEEEKLERYISPEPVDQVLELSSGRVKQLRLSIGDHITVKPILN